MELVIDHTVYIQRIKKREAAVTPTASLPHPDAPGLQRVNPYH